MAGDHKEISTEPTPIDRVVEAMQKLGDEQLMEQFAQLLVEHSEKMQQDYDRLERHMVNLQRDTEQQLFQLHDQMGVKQEETGAPGIETEEGSELPQITELRVDPVTKKLQFKSIKSKFVKGGRYSDLNDANGNWQDLTGIDGILPAGSHGSIAYHNGSSWVVLAPGGAGKHLQTNGADANPTWETVAHVEDGTVTNQLLYWDNDEGVWKAFACGSAQVLGWLADEGASAQVLMSNGSGEPSFKYITPSSMQTIAAAGGPSEAYQVLMSSTSQDSGVSYPISYKYALPLAYLVSTNQPDFNWSTGGILRYTPYTGTHFGGMWKSAYIDLAEVLRSGTNPNETIPFFPDGTDQVMAIRRTDQLLSGLSGAADGKILKMNDDGTHAWAEATTLPDGSRGDILIYNGSAWANLSAGSDGKVLTTHGAAQPPSWEESGSGLPDATGRSARMVLQLSADNDKDSAVWDWVRSV